MLNIESPEKMLSDMMEYDEDNKCIVTKNFLKPKIEKDFCPNKLTLDRLREFAAKNHTFQVEIETGKIDLAKDFLSRVIRITCFMRDFGLKSGDVVSTCTQNHLNTYVPILGAQFAGVLVASTDPTQTYEETKYLISLVKPKLFFVGKGVEELIGKCIETLGIECQIISFEPHKKLLNFDQIMTKYKDVNEDEFTPHSTVNQGIKEPSIIYFTSGTTGLPKATIMSNGMIRAYYSSIPQYKLGDRILGVSNPYWSSSVMTFCSACLGGLTMYVVNGFDAKSYWDTLRKYKISVAVLTYTKAAETLHYLDEPIEGLKDLLLTGGQMPFEFTQKLKQKLPNCNVRNPYAATEIGVVTFAPGTMKSKSLGIPVPNGQLIKVVSPDTEEVLGFNETGEIRVKSDYQFSGYYNFDSRDSWDSDGFFKTGDLGYYDKDFEIFVVDRIKDIFKYKAHHISPIIVENALCSHEDVARAIAFGVPHPIDDNHIMAAVVLKENATVSVDELVVFANKRLGELEQIRAGIWIVEESLVPYTVTGKIKRNALRDLILSQKKIEYNK